MLRNWRRLINDAEYLDGLATRFAALLASSGDSGRAHRVLLRRLNKATGERRQALLGSLQVCLLISASKFNSAEDRLCELLRDPETSSQALPALLNNLAIIYSNTNRPAEAVNLLNWAITIMPRKTRDDFRAVEAIVHNTRIIYKWFEGSDDSYEPQSWFCEDVC